MRWTRILALCKNHPWFIYIKTQGTSENVWWKISMFWHLQNCIIVIEIQKLKHSVKINMHSHICMVWSVCRTTSLSSSITIVCLGQDVRGPQAHHHHSVGVAAGPVALLLLVLTCPTAGGLATEQIHQGLAKFEILEKFNGNEKLTCCSKLNISLWHRNSMISVESD